MRTPPSEQSLRKWWSDSDEVCWSGRAHSATERGHPQPVWGGRRVAQSSPGSARGQLDLQPGGFHSETRPPAQMRHALLAIMRASLVATPACVVHFHGAHDLQSFFAAVLGYPGLVVIGSTEFGEERGRGCSHLSELATSPYRKAIWFLRPRFSSHTTG